jgi:hypothetical protein
VAPWPQGATRTSRIAGDLPDPAVTRPAHTGQHREDRAAEAAADSVRKQPDTPERQAAPSRPDRGHLRFLGKRPDVMQGAPELTRVPTLLAPGDLAAADALIVAGIAATRSEVLRRAVGRIREQLR